MLPCRSEAELSLKEQSLLFTPFMGHRTNIEMVGILGVGLESIYPQHIESGFICYGKGLLAEIINTNGFQPFAPILYFV